MRTEHTEPTLKPRFLSPRKAAAYLGDVITESTLAKKRCIGGGPKFFKIGRNVSYPICAIQAYRVANVHMSTSTYQSDGGVNVACSQ